MTRLPIALGLAGLAIVAQPSWAENPITTTYSLEDFTHSAAISASADPLSIKLESAKVTRVFTKAESVADSADCEAASAKTPGGATDCPYTVQESPAKAYVLTYSYSGEPLASDETRGRYFTFRVYFRPEELAPEVREAIAAGPRKRAELAKYFQLETTSLLVRQTVIDQHNSSFCEGYYIDGLWVHSDRDCHDQVTYTTADIPSGLITVRVAQLSQPRQAD